MDDGGAHRVHFIDWLRILAVLLLFPFHVLRVFNNENFYVKASTLPGAADGVIAFISVWHMPLLFFLAGCSTYLALRRRTGGEYAWERVKRLLVPLVFGIFVLIPPETWYGARFNSGYTGSYWEYLSSRDFLRWNVQEGGDYYGGFGVGQLWFIMFLFLISLIVLPLVVWGARGKGVPRIQAFCRRLARPVWWIMAVVILFVGSLAPSIPGGPFVYYLLVFVLGFVAMSDPAFGRSVEHFRVPAFVAGAGLTLACVFALDFYDSLPDPSFGRAGLALMAEAATWLMLMGAMGVGRHYLDRTSRIERYLAEGSYPVYILHQTVIVVLAFYVVGFAVPVWAQGVILLVLAVAGTFALYEIVRRVGVLRFLFGMRPGRRARSPARPETTVPTEGSPEV